MVVGVVVLNYINYKETLNCLSSLMVQKEVQLSIVVVDNGSGNNSLFYIKEHVNSFDMRNGEITFVQLESNVGFAGGMNCGIQVLRGKGIDYIFLANSDLCFSTSGILSELVSGYESGVGVLNPCVYNIDGSFAKPIFFKKRLMWMRMVKSFMLSRHNKRKARRRCDIKKDCSETDERMDRSNSYECEQRDRACFRVCGMGYMLTPDFWEHYNYVYPETFLYNEEYALMLYLQKAGLDTKTVHTEAVIHKHGASTPAKSKKKRKISGGHFEILKLMPLSEAQIKNGFDYPIATRYRKS